MNFNTKFQISLTEKQFSSLEQERQLGYNYVFRPVSALLSLEAPLHLGRISLDTIIFL